MARNVVTKHVIYSLRPMKKIIFPAVLLSLPLSLSAQLVINEVLYDPAFDSGDPSVGDANGDGTRDSSEDEFVELVNTSGGSLSLSGWTVSDNNDVVHTFGATVLADGQAVVIFGGGTPTGTFGGSVAVAANGSWGGLGNSGDQIEVSDAQAGQVAFYDYSIATIGNDQSIVLSTELDDTSGYIAHSSAAGAGGAPFSPGTRVGGAPFGNGSILTVVIIPDIFPENAGLAAASGTVSRSGDTSSELVVTLSSDDTTEATVPATVTIPVGQASASFDVDAVDDLDQDENQTVTISASGIDIFSGTAVITVADNEDPIPSITLSADPTTFSENGGSATITIEISASSPSGYTFNLASDDTSELTVPASVSIAPNETTATFTASGVDDSDTDGSKVVSVTATDPNTVIVSNSTSLTVSDDEDFFAPNIIINEIRIDQPGDDFDEYIEFYSETPDVSLNLLTLIVIGDGAPADGSGVIEDVYSFDGLSFSGNYFVAANNSFTFGTPDTVLGGMGIFENGDNLTFLLVSNFSGTAGDDLDTDDDGVLDSTPWGSIIDGVGLLETDEDPPTTTERSYAAALDLPAVGPDGPFVPGHVFRSPGGSRDWQIGPFTDSDGDPDADPPVEAVSRLDTPGSENASGSGTPTGPELTVNSFEIDFENERGVINASGLGTKVWQVETSTDLGDEVVWTPVFGGADEQDQEDGSVDFVFFFTASSAPEKRFYRLAEVPN